MTEQELASSWPDLAVLVTELRGIDRALADRLVDAVQYSSTSGEIYAGVGNALYENRRLRAQLTPSGMQAWQRVMAGVGRAFGRPPFLEWLTHLFRSDK